jgi:hypothetical protein
MYILIIIFIILLVLLTWQSSIKCGCGSSLPEAFCGCAKNMNVENFISSVFCDEKLTFNGVNYQLWKNNRINKVFKTYDEYVEYWKFAYGNRKDKPQCTLLKPIDKNINTPDGTIISTPHLQQIDTRYFNIEHFTGNRDVEATPPTERNYMNNEDKSKDSYMIRSQNAIRNYLKNNKECHERLMNKDSEFYLIFQKSYEMYVKDSFKKMLGYIPNSTQLNDLNIEELDVYIDIIEGLPNCQSLIMRYFKPATKHSKRKTSIWKDGVKVVLDIPDWVEAATTSTFDFVSSLLFQISNDCIDKDKCMNDDKGPKSIDDNIASNFAFKPTIKYPEKEANRNIASQYGWSFIPPQFWSVPQPRPPICLPADNNVSTVTSIYDKSVPLNVLELSKVNFPENTTGVDKRFLNSDYYYPGVYINKGKYDPRL